MRRTFIKIATFVYMLSIITNNLQLYFYNSSVGVIYIYIFVYAYIIIYKQYSTATE